MSIELDFKPLFDMQKQLDDHINEVRKLSGEDVMQERMLALLVEIGEFANETRCFKFWSSKPMSEKKIVLFEFVDCMHFLLSIGNYSGFTYSDGVKMDFVKYRNVELTTLFINFFHSVVRFRNEPLPLYYVDMWSYLFSIGEALEFTEQDMLNAYIEKNEVNFERQASGY